MKLALCFGRQVMLWMLDMLWKTALWFFVVECDAEEHVAAAKNYGGQDKMPYELKWKYKYNGITRR
jgi:hypothetical protein